MSNYSSYSRTDDDNGSLMGQMEDLIIGCAVVLIGYCLFRFFHSPVGKAVGATVNGAANMMQWSLSSPYAFLVSILGGLVVRGVVWYANRRWKAYLKKLDDKASAEASSEDVSAEGAGEPKKLAKASAEDSPEGAGEEESFMTWFRRQTTYKTDVNGLLKELGSGKLAQSVQRESELHVELHMELLDLQPVNRRPESYKKFLPSDTNIEVKDMKLLEEKFGEEVVDAHLKLLKNDGTRNTLAETMKRLSVGQLEPIAKELLDKNNPNGIKDAKQLFNDMNVAESKLKTFLNVIDYEYLDDEELQSKVRELPLSPSSGKKLKDALRESGDGVFEKLVKAPEPEVKLGSENASKVSPNTDTVNIGKKVPTDVPRVGELSFRV